MSVNRVPGSAISPSVLYYFFWKRSSEDKLHRFFYGGNVFPVNQLTVAMHLREDQYPYYNTYGST